MAHTQTDTTHFYSIKATPGLYSKYNPGAIKSIFSQPSVTYQNASLHCIYTPNNLLWSNYMLYRNGYFLLAELNLLYTVLKDKTMQNLYIYIQWGIQNFI